MAGGLPWWGCPMGHLEIGDASELAWDSLSSLPSVVYRNPSDPPRSVLPSPNGVMSAQQCSCSEWPLPGGLCPNRT